MFEPTTGPARESLEEDKVEQLLANGTLIVDERRRRPRYFDGRFLTAADLTREQNYFLTRQSDLGQAGGAGVVYGLLVEKASASTSVIIRRGHGITPAGELVVVGTDLTVDLANVAEMQRLDAAFGLLKVPREPARNRSGLFVVALRPVEYSANPIASYPTSITGQRSVEDSDIIEAVAVTLIPFPDNGATTGQTNPRSRVAREIFVEGGTRGTPAEALPLALIALERGVLQWIDPWLVRREVGAEHGDILGMGFAPRALREAHLLQYDKQLAEVLAQRDASGRGRRFAASEYFLALPPAGRMPSAAVDPRDFTQTFFPSNMDVDLSIVPEDEVPALLEESLLLPPIDLTLTGNALASSSVLVVVPLPRSQARAYAGRLANIMLPLRPAAPGMLARRTPLEALRSLTLPRVAAVSPAVDDLVHTAWREALAATQLLWYVRRRNVHFKAEAAGLSIQIAGDEFRDQTNLAEMFDRLDIRGRLTRLKMRADDAADSELIRLLNSHRFKKTVPLTFWALADLEAQSTLNLNAVVAVEQKLINPAIRVGMGIEAFIRVNQRLNQDRVQMNAVVLLTTAEFNDWDKLGGLLTTTELREMAKKLYDAVPASGATPNKTAFVKLIKDKLSELGG